MWFQCKSSGPGFQRDPSAMSHVLNFPRSHSFFYTAQWLFYQDEICYLFISRSWQILYMWPHVFTIRSLRQWCGPNISVLIAIASWGNKCFNVAAVGCFYHFDFIVFVNEDLWLNDLLKCTSADGPYYWFGESWKHLLHERHCSISEVCAWASGSIAKVGKES